MNDNIWAKSVAEKIKSKYPEVVARNLGKIPYSAKNGVFDDQSKENICWWTNGFYGALLWQLYHTTKDEIYKKEAEVIEEKLEAVLMNYQGMDHDSGFRFLITAVANYRMSGDMNSKNRGLLAAANMAGRFNPVGNYIRAWNPFDEKRDNTGYAIIDCMMNLPLLYWASEETQDGRFYNIAVRHADTVMKYFIREDGSSKHIVEFDSYTGEYIQDFGGQGYAQGSSWTRGQAWALYGFALSYKYTKDTKYLDMAKKIATYFIKNIPENGLIPVDFKQPADCSLEDTTAAAIAASGMLLMNEQDQELGAYFKESAIKLLKTLDLSRCNYEKDVDQLLEKGTSAFHVEQHEMPIIYGDYYYIEAIFRLTGEEFFVW